MTEKRAILFRALILLAVLILISPFGLLQGSEEGPPLFKESGKNWGLTRPTIYGPVSGQKYILETTGTGIGIVDYDNDNRPDLFFVNGSRLEGFQSQPPPVNMFFRNLGDRFRDVTEESGVGHAGWGQGVCVADYDGDGWTDLYVTYYGHNRLYRNQGDRTFDEVSQQAGVGGRTPRWGAGCTFVDYDLDGDVDLFVAHYVAYEDAAAFEPGEKSFCALKGVLSMCGPQGLSGDVNLLYRNNGDGTFSDVSEEANIASAEGFYCFQPITADFDQDGWPDIYVSCDSTPNILYRNNGDGTFTDLGLVSGSALSADGNEQAGMGVAVTDFNRDGRPDILVTNFSDDSPTLYKNLSNWNFSDVTLQAGLGRYTRYLGWGAVFFDHDNDGWEDLLMVNGHIFSGVDGLGLGSYRQKNLLYRNRGNGTFKDMSTNAGPAMLEESVSRGAVAEDFNGDGYLDLVITHLNEVPSLLLNQDIGNNWVMVRLVGAASNKSAIGARVTVEAGGYNQIREVRSSCSFYSSNGLRLHFGIGKAEKIDNLYVYWPSGEVSQFPNLDANRIISIREDRGLQD